jgi:hypothetical protein
MTDDSDESARWAKPVERLSVGELPEEALNLNVDGKQLAGAIQGFGQLWQKTYRAALTGADCSPDEVIAVWKSEYASFWPENSTLYGPISRLEPGDVGVINASQSGLKMSTGVMVMYADDESFAFALPQGHMFSGWITFSAHDEDGTTVAQVQPYFRTSDPMYELIFKLYLNRKEDEIWYHTLQSLATRFGTEGSIAHDATLIDNRRQWRNAKNVWHNAGMRTTLHTVATPFRAVRRRARRTNRKVAS